MTRIFVGNLAYQTTEADVRNTFERFGHVASVRLVTDQVTGKPRGFGFVRMPRIDDADEAIHRLSGQSLHGRPLVVNEARAREGISRPEPVSRWHLV